MEEPKLVTLAIHTYEKAQILQSLLSSEGVESYLHNVNQLQPVISAGVRVRIKESDLAKALRIIEDSNWDQEDVEKEIKKKKGKGSEPERSYVLIPIDFSEYTMKVCEFGINFAANRGLDAILMHVYYGPFFNTPLAVGDTAAYQVGMEINLRKEMQRVVRQMNKLKKELRERISREELPEVKLSSIVREGAPEDSILSYSRRHKPVAIVMGTRGKGRKDSDLIGSVAAEVIDSARVPVFVIPEEAGFSKLREVKHIAVATSFDQRDLVLFDSMKTLFEEKYQPTMHLFNISTTTPEWNEVQLSAVSQYYQTHYPNTNIVHQVLDEGDFSLALEKFIRQEDIEMIVVNTYRRGFLAKLFNPSMARRMLFHAGTPLLVMHGKNG